MEGGGGAIGPTNQPVSTEERKEIKERQDRDQRGKISTSKMEGDTSKRDRHERHRSILRDKRRGKYQIEIEIKERDQTGTDQRKRQGWK